MTDEADRPTSKYEFKNLEFKIRSRLYVIYSVVFFTMSWTCYEKDMRLAAITVGIVLLSIILRVFLSTKCETASSDSCGSKLRNCLSLTFIWIIVVLCFLVLLLLVYGYQVKDGNYIFSITSNSSRIYCFDVLPCEFLYFYPMFLFTIDTVCYIGVGHVILKAVFWIYEKYVDPETALHKVFKWNATIAFAILTPVAVVKTGLVIHNFGIELDPGRGIAFMLVILFWCVTFVPCLMKQGTSCILPLNCLLLSILLVTSNAASICQNISSTTPFAIYLQNFQPFSLTFESWLELSLLHAGVFILFLLMSVEVILDLSSEIKKISMAFLLLIPALLLLPLILLSLIYIVCKRMCKRHESHIHPTPFPYMQPARPDRTYSAHSNQPGSSNGGHPWWVRTNQHGTPV